MSGKRRPVALTPGAGIHVLSPSGPVDPKRFERGRARLAHLFDQQAWSASESLFARSGYFAGDDAIRIRALHEAFSDDSSVIWCARGGYGLTRIINKLDAKLLSRKPKCIVGFSDVTALLAWAYARADICGLHGPVVTQSGTVHPADLEATKEWLVGEVPAPLEAESDAVSVINGGSVEGPLFAANLEVLRSLIGTPFLPDLRGHILAIEEVGEAPYRIDRSLTQLIASGALRGVAGVVVGQLTACDDPKGEGDRPSAAQVVVERLTRLGVPVFTGAPFGHASARNFPLPIGARVRLDADNATLLFLEPLCA
jgi:muramoyltetrapeptide carboxypeptidase